MDFLDFRGARRSQRFKQTTRIVTVARGFCSITSVILQILLLAVTLTPSDAASPRATPSPSRTTPAPHATPAPSHPAADKPAFQKKEMDLKDRAPDDSLFGGKLTQPITLRRAIEMALQNNLEAQFERIGVTVQGSQLRFAAGAFDPVFNFSAQHQSVRSPQDVNNPSTTQAIQSQQQIELAVAQGQTAVNASALSLAQEAQALGNAIETQLQSQALAEVNFQRGLIGQAPVSLPGNVAPTLGLIPVQQIAQPLLQQVVVLDQQNTQEVASIQARTPYGTRYQFQASVNYFRNTFSGDTNPVTPLYQTFAGITIEQPLLKNFGRDANLADLRVAELNKRAQVLNWRQNVSTSIQGVMATYYDMLAALDDMHVRQDAITADSKLVELYRRRLDLGFSTPLEVQQAEVAVSTDREALLTSRNVYLERQFALKRLIFQKSEINDPRIFVPEAAPTLSPPSINRTELLGTAYQYRYDYQATILSAEVQDVRLKFAHNQLLPELDIVATYGFNGLSGGVTHSMDQIYSGDTPQWSIGLNFQVPLGNRQPRAQYNAVAGQKEQAIIKVRESELQVNVDVDTVISRIETNRQRVQTSRQTRELGEQAVRIAYRRLDEGLISAFDVIEQQRKLYDAKAREIASIGELNKSITQLWLVTGTVLQHENINFREPHDTIHVSPLGVSIKEATR